MTWPPKPEPEKEMVTMALLFPMTRTLAGPGLSRLVMLSRTVSVCPLTRFTIAR